MTDRTSEAVKLYVEDTDGLVDLVRAVMDDLQGTTQRPDWKQKEAQLREVSAAITKLEKAKFEVPDDLRRLKMDLVGELAVREEAEQRLEGLGKALADLAQELGHKVAEPSTKAKKSTGSKKGGKRKPRADRTPMEELRRVMLAALKDLGGSAHCREILDLMEQKLDGKLKPGDLELRKAGETVWRNNTRWERQRMIDEGVLKKGSPLGYWELNETTKRGTGR